MAKDELVDSHVSLKQCRLAVNALHEHETKKAQKQEETELLPGKEQNIWLNVTVKKIPSGQKFKPAKIPIIHPLVDPRTTPVCLITKDPQREYKTLLETHNIKFISRVVGIEKLKGKFKPFEARRMLLKENGLFLADERVIPLLPKLLGRKWFEAKKQPIPVCLTRKDLKGELERAISSTYMNQNQGTCTSIKIGILSHKPAQILANISSGLPAVVSHIKGGWDNIQSFHIKTNSSVSLPIWSCSLDESEGGRWSGLTLDADEEVAASDDDSEEDEIDIEVAKNTKTKKVKSKEEKTVEVAVSKGIKRRLRGELDGDVESPGKRTKLESADGKVGISRTTPAKTSQAPNKTSSPIQLASSTKAAKISPTILDSEPVSKKKSRKSITAEEGNLLKKSKSRATEISTSVASDIANISKVATVTKNDLKQKRKGDGSEKKKNKVTKDRLGRSAKNEVIGKKIARG